VLFRSPLDRIPPIKERPTEEDAVKARDELLEVVAEFPFETEAHRGAWLSLVLTGLSRSAIDGSVPLFLIDANVRGAGKSLLAQVASIIMTGRKSPVMLWPKDDEDEQRKSITALAIAGDNVVLLDNLDGILGGPALNAALTSTTWIQRILGVSQMTARLPLTAIWIATANNCELGRDTTRRTIHIRIKSEMEHPEDRVVDRPKLKEWTQENRPRLVAAALTILRAYEVAGRPDMSLGPMADYVAWTKIRHVVAWLGYPDPLETQRLLSSQADLDAGELRSLLLGIQSVTAASEWVGASDLLARAIAAGGEQFKQALLEYCGDRTGNLPSAKSLGRRLRRYLGRVADGMAVESKNGSAGMKLWRVAGATNYGRKAEPIQGDLL